MKLFVTMELQTVSVPYLLLRLDNTKLIFNQPKFTIGRGLSNSYVLENLQISRTHCMFEENNGIWHLTDQSSNGTLLNNKRIATKTPHIISNGDVVRLTDTHEFIFVNMKGDSLDDDLDLAAVIDEAEFKHEGPTVEVVTSDNNDMLGISESSKLNNKPREILITTLSNRENYDHIYCKRTNNEATNLASTSNENSNSVISNCGNEMVSARNSNTNQQHVIENESSQRLQPPQSSEDHLEQIENELQCSICMELFIKATTLNCSHSFCKYCLEEWRKKNKKCPICRTKITTANLTIVLDNFIAKVMETASADVREKREEVIKGREQTQTVLASTTEPDTTVRPIVATPIEISSDDASTDADSYEDFDDYLNYDEEDYNGVPGAYFGGYGHCFSCGDSGHWANGCPYR